MFNDLRTKFRRLGVDLQKRPGEYTVGYIGPSKPEAFERLDEAVARGEELAAARPVQPPICRRRGLRGVPDWALKPKALRRRIFRRSNAKYRAWLLKNGGNSDDRLVRESTVCPLCEGSKGTCLVVCWPCYRTHGLR